jgi:hypothetical protein
MIKQAKLVLLATAVGAILTSAHAAIYNGDLLIGFTTQSGNDVIYDLGAESSLVNGEQWNLASLLTGYNLNNVNWGVIGDNESISGQPWTAWTTTDGTVLPPKVPNAQTLGQLDTATKSIFQNFGAAGTGQSISIASTDDNSWNQQTINGGGPTQYVNVYNNPNVLGATSDSFYSVVANNSTPVLAGSFTLGTNGVVTFNLPQPPKPRIVSITRSAGTSTIYFTTANGPTYTLYYTNSAGLTTSVTNWPSSPTTLVGNGLTNSLSDITTDSNRFYRIGAH